MLTDPLALALGHHSDVISTQLPVRDARPLVLIVSLLVLAGVYAVRLARRIAVRDERLVVVVSVLVAYLIWFVAFDIERYMAPGYLLPGGFAVLAVRETMAARGNARAVVAGLLLALIMVTARPIRTGRVPITADWFDLSVPHEVAQPDTLYVMSGFGPMSWIATRREALGEGAKLIRVGGNFPAEPQSRMGRRLSAVIAAHQGPIRSLAVDGWDLVPGDWLGVFGLARSGDCAVLTSKAGAIRSCVLVRARSVRP